MSDASPSPPSFDPEKIEFYINQPNIKPGPYTFDQLVEKLKDQQLGANSLIWMEGVPNWLPLAYVFSAPEFQGKHPFTFEYRDGTYWDFYLLAWSRLFQIHGRSRRKEFLSFFGINYLIFMVSIEAIPQLSETLSSILDPTQAALLMLGSKMLIFLCKFLAILITILTIPLAIRRLHDVNQRGYFLPLSIITLVPLPLLFYLLFFKESERANNRFGQDPKAFLP